MKYFLIILIFISSYSFGFTPQYIWTNSELQSFDLSGRDGFPGKDGADAFAMDCAPGILLAGRSGEDGRDGEKGENGRDVLIQFDNFSELKLIHLNQSPGKGGSGGKGGLGGQGCNGGDDGPDGIAGLNGSDGFFGRIFLAPKKYKLSKEKTSSLVTLKDLATTELILTRHIWAKLKGAKKLFHSGSQIDNDFYFYEKTNESKIYFNWNSDKEFENYQKTKVAIKLTDRGLEVNSYSGAILVYTIKQIGNDFYLDVLDAKSELQLKNLSLGKIRKSGEKLTLEVKEKYNPGFNIKTDFVISIYEFDDLTRQQYFIGQFALKKSQIVRKDKVFYLKVGELNFPPEFKRTNVKLQIHLSIYRKARMQTRVLTLKGIFRI